MMKACEICAVICTAALIVFCAWAGCPENERTKTVPEPRKTVLRASVRLPLDTRMLLPGYNYHLLGNLARDKGMIPEISVEPRRDVNLDGLLDGTEDIVVLPLEDSASIGEGFHRLNVDSVCFWVMKKSHIHTVRMAEKFIDNFIHSDEYRHLHYIYTMTYDPFLAVRRKVLSPYDGLIREQADSLGWDWRMLAAMIYQESRFHIEAGSQKGARGLMQLIPETGQRFGAGDLTDPERNIRAGGRYLRHLHRQFGKVSASPEEHIKITLAAYNAGAGRIHDCITTARRQNIDPGYWENLISVIPGMRDSSILDTVNLRCGIFQGYETIAYVDRVLAIYGEFCRMCPEK